MIESSGTPPEALPPAEDIRGARRTLQQTHESMRQLDARLTD